ncbi:MAG: hypothetical protein WBQ65_18430, partial [Bryobacteraceae bacterium]
LVHRGLVEATAVDQKEAFTAGRIFFETEGILPAPESAHAIAQVIAEVEQEKRSGSTATIVFCLSGTGYLDLPSYASLLGSSQEEPAKSHLASSLPPAGGEGANFE